MKPAIILLEDNPDHAWLAMRTIQKYSVEYNIIHFYNGDDLFDFLNTTLNELPKIIFIDMHMPGMNGVQVLRKLRRDLRFVNVPIIMLTSSKQESDITESYALGATSYLVKPLDEMKYRDLMINLNYLVAFPAGVVK